MPPARPRRKGQEASAEEQEGVRIRHFGPQGELKGDPPRLGSRKGSRGLLCCLNTSHRRRLDHLVEAAEIDRLQRRTREARPRVHHGQHGRAVECKLWDTGHAEREPLQEDPCSARLILTDPTLKRG